MNISPIQFKGFKTFDDFADFIVKYMGYDLLILIRTKHIDSEKWHYTYEILLWSDFTHEWLNDWYEGQEYIEYLGGAVLDYDEQNKKE